MSWQQRDTDPEYHFVAGNQPVRCWHCGERLPVNDGGYYRECAEIVPREAHVIVHAECVRDTDALA